MTSFEDQLVEHRVYLMRFARLQLRNDAWAEDAVSETLLAALSKPQAFGNRSQLKTWLVGILKHKVIDHIRLNTREISTPESDADNQGEELTSWLSKPTVILLTRPPLGVTHTKPCNSASFLKCSTPVLSACRPRWAGFF